MFINSAPGAEPMGRGTSLYLDLVRFSAALAVFAFHLEGFARGRFDAFWTFHLPFYSQTAVTVFFVLSGYVIAHVLGTRERTPLDYTASRFARLYSVVVPALILTAMCNYFIAMRHPEDFDTYNAPGGTPAPLRYLGTALFMSHFWLVRDLTPPSASPFWSLSFEAAYYVGIALFVFTKGRIRFLSLVLLCAVQGPTMVLLAPNWFLGYGVYHVSQRRQLRAGSAIVIWLGSIILLSLSPHIAMHFREHLAILRMPDRSLGGLLASYAAAICFAANIVAFNAFSERAEPFFRPFTGLIRWLGSMTFALYLFHYPLLSLFATYRVGEPSSALPMIWLTGGPLLIVATLGHVCERSKGAYKQFFLWMWGGRRHAMP